MKKKGTWFLAASLAAMIVTSGIAMAATNTDKDTAQAPKQAQVQDKDGFHGHGHGRYPGGKMDQSELLKLLKIDAATLHSERAAGKSLLDIAKAHDVSEKKLTDFFVSQMSKRIDEGQKQGRLTAERAKEMKSNLKEHVTKMIKNTGHQERGRFEMKEVLTLLGIDANTLHSERAAGKSLLDIAKAHNVSEQQLTEVISSQMSKRIDEDQKQGRITAERAKEMKSNLKEHVAKMINNNGPQERGRFEMTEVLTLLGIDAKTLHNELQQGKTLVAIAAEHGVSEQQLKDTLKESAAKRIDEAVKAGRIPQDKADTAKTKAMERAENFVNGVHPERHGERHNERPANAAE